MVTVELRNYGDNALNWVPSTALADTVNWNFTVPETGQYKVYAKWPADADRATDAHYTIYRAGGSAAVTVNQRQNGGQWHLLGDYPMDAGMGHGVELAASATGSVAADAIRIVAASAAPINVNYIHADHLATPQKMTDGAKTVVWDRQARPFGETISLTGTADLPLRFPGQYYDSETNLHYNYFRDYDPSTGRYVQSDPIGFWGGLNTYAYVGSSPLRWVDPRGLEAIGPEDQEPLPAAKPQPNGNLWGPPLPQNGVCDPPADIPASFNNCVPKCCKEHDGCFKQYGCNASSWGMILFGEYQCTGCNRQGASCVWSALGNPDCDKDGCPRLAPGEGGGGA